MNPLLELRVDDAGHGQRLDRYVRKLLPTVPLGAIFKHLRSGNVRVDGDKVEPGLRLAAGMLLTLRLPAADLGALAARLQRPVAMAPAAAAPTAGRGPAPRVVFRDRDVLIVDKPAGLAVQPGSGQGDDHLVAWVLATAAAARTATFVPAPAHRLDRGTSGLCAIGVSPVGLRGLAAAFRDGTAHKVYLAIVHAVPVPPQGTIELPLRAVRAPRRDGPKVEVASDGKPARTDYTVEQAVGDRARLRLVLHHGRMHQLRAHLAAIGHPIVGDGRYGSPVRLGDTFLLHAHELELPHPVTGEPLRAVAPPPAAFRL